MTPTADDRGGISREPTARWVFCCPLEPADQEPAVSLETPGTKAAIRLTSANLVAPIAQDEVRRRYGSLRRAIEMGVETMCDYSLHAVASRPAKAGDVLTTSAFERTTSRGFSAAGEPGVAVCLMPGTELAFAEEPRRDGLFERLLHYLGLGRVGSTLARFRKVDTGIERAHHDALEFANGEIVLLTSLRAGQNATVLQLPVVTDMGPPLVQNIDETASDRAVS